MVNIPNENNKSENTRLVADIRLGHTGKLLTQLKQACRQGNESRIDQLLEYARLLPRQDKKERIIEVLRAEGLFSLQSNICPNCGLPVKTWLDDGFLSGYYDGYNHSNPDPSSWIYRTTCERCGDVKPQEKYEEGRIRELLMG